MKSTELISSGALLHFGGNSVHTCFVLDLSRFYLFYLFFWISVVFKMESEYIKMGLKVFLLLQPAPPLPPPRWLTPGQSHISVLPSWPWRQPSSPSGDKNLMTLRNRIPPTNNGTQWVMVGEESNSFWIWEGRNRVYMNHKNPYKLILLYLKLH